MLEEQMTQQILDLLYSIQEACVDLFHYAQANQEGEFRQTAESMKAGLACISTTIKSSMDQGDVGSKKLYPMCQSISASLQRIYPLYSNDQSKCLSKIEYELLPLIQEANLHFYFFGYVVHQNNGMETYYKEALIPLTSNSYIDEAIERGRYRYEVSIVVIAYNKLDYTKRCVKSLLENIPKGLHYELILVNHGSTDETKEYFEQICPHKQIDISVNGGGLGAFFRTVEGEFTILVSNDVIVMPNVIENLLACIRSDPKIAWVVPTTPNVSNLQTIPVSYSTEEEMLAFARKNNQRSNPFRWEQRVRLCNPMDIKRNSVFVSSQGLGLNGYFHSAENMAFPDDRASLLLRRHGYKMILAKDAYCHHFGSVTLKEEIQKKNTQKFYQEGRREFYKIFGVDPWGTGFCYDPVFSERVVGEVFGHIEVLGINCGLGSNSLKIKEQVREYGRNTDVVLTNITDSSIYLKDLSGVSDSTKIIQNNADFYDFMEGKQFTYIIWEEAFIDGQESKKIYEKCLHSLLPGGVFFLKKNTQNSSLIEACSDEIKPLQNGWYKVKQEKKNLTKL